VRITPIDIRKQEFRKGMRGYDVDEVDTFLAMVADEMEDLIAAAQQAKTEVASLKERLDDYQQMEATMRETLVTVQRAAEEKREAAHKEAEIILKEAEVRAGNWIEDAHRSVRDVKKELARLGAMRDSYVTRLKMLVQAQLDMLKLAEMEEETPDETLDMFEERLEALKSQARERIVQVTEAPTGVEEETEPAPESFSLVEETIDAPDAEPRLEENEAEEPDEAAEDAAEEPAEAAENEAEEEELAG
jgi:cell division initiation protein